jgi:hypothetical protein
MKKGLHSLSLSLISLLIFSGCRGLQSEMEKSQLREARPTLVIDGVTFQLVSSLKRTMYPDGKRFDLNGELTIKSLDGSFPTNLNAYHLALKPGGAGYYVMNFREDGGAWFSVDGDNRFSGNTRIEKDRVVINFLWKDQGGGWGSKPQDYVIYDVSVSLTDAQKKKRGVLTTLDIPTDP